MEVIAIGNGTAGRETELFTAEVIACLRGTGQPRRLYGGQRGGGVRLQRQQARGRRSSRTLTSPCAARFPLPAACRIRWRSWSKSTPRPSAWGSTSTICPRSGWDEALGGVVEDCVNTVGVDLNTASPSLLEQVVGVSAAVSKNIVAYREENGAFHSRVGAEKSAQARAPRPLSSARASCA